MTHRSFDYNSPDHLARVAKTEAFIKSAVELGVRPEDLQRDYGRALQEVVARHLSAELAEFEAEVAAEALDATLQRLKAAKAAA